MLSPVTASGGTGSYTFTLCNAADDAAGVLPAGMSFNTETGQISGTATATDANGVTATQTFTVTVNVVATRLVVTGSSTQTAGSSQSLTITARDASGNVATTYTGDNSHFLEPVMHPMKQNQRFATKMVRLLILVTQQLSRLQMV